MTIDAAADPYVMLGRVVTMGAADVIDRGAIYIQAGEIIAVQDEQEDAPAGFEDATEVRTGGTIYPGLIELHNHLSYNAIPLWELERDYMHSGHWSNTDQYKMNVTKPVAVLANTHGLAEAMVRFAESRCLLGGVTTSQGITLQANSGVKSLYKGIVRNVESPLEEGLEGADPRIGAPDKDLDKYKAKLDKATCYLQHLSEGINDGRFDTAIKQFTGLQRPDGSWAIGPTLCGIHSTALLPEHMQVMADHEASIVWSPLSNFLLYGATTNVAAARDAGVPIALGSDWAPSGTKNLLGELKVAKIHSDHEGGLFTDRELCDMVTTVPAQILGWQGRIGRIEAGKLADLIVLHGTSGDVYDNLIRARETTVTLAVIDGIPRAGQSRMMKKFGDGTETISVGGSTRVMDLTPDPLGQDLGVTLTEATARLANALENLPEMADQLDNAIAAGWTPGVSLTAAGIDASQMPPGFEEPPWRVVLEFEEEDSNEDFIAALQAGDLADWVHPMELDGITVPDDRQFLERVVRAVNVPRYVKEQLPAMHGRRLAVPDLGDIEAFATASDLDGSIDVAQFLAEPFLLDIEEKREIIRQAVLLLEGYYVHLPMKRNMHAVDPVQKLRILGHRIEIGGNIADAEFHTEISEVFDSLRDLHTAYRLPRPYRGKVAWLPFSIEEYKNRRDGEPAGEPRFLISKVITDDKPDTFVAGVEVLYWNGVPIKQAVARLAASMPGGNPAARWARAMNSLTLRSFTRGQIPDEHWVTLRYRRSSGVGRTMQARFPWKIFEPRRGIRTLSPELVGSFGATGLGLDDQTDDLHQAKKAMFAADHVAAEAELAAGASVEEPEPREDEIPSALPTVFRARRKFNKDGKEFGYLRIFTFNVDSADEFVDEMERLLAEFNDNGLIVDVRGNGGGLIHAAERALELLSPRRIEPEPAQFINTPATLSLCRLHDGQRGIPGLNLAPWVESLERSVASGAKHSFEFSITPEADCNARGQAYQGPKVLIMDGLCYSAADMFIAGFQDHELGKIIGLHENTGAGGANVWSHRLLRYLTAQSASASGLAPLAAGADLRVAVRRTLRVGANAGEIVEDFGIEPDHRYTMTRADLLYKNRDLIQMATEILEGAPHHKITVRASGRKLVARSVGADRVDLTTGDRTLHSYVPERGRTEIDLSDFAIDQPYVEAVAFSENRPVARARQSLT